MLDIRSIIRILPHKPPAVLVDRVDELDPGERIVAVKNLTANESWFAGHFPGLPIMPEALMIEIAAQASCLLAYGTDKYNPATSIISVRGVKKAKFHRPAFPGDTLEIESKLLNKRSNIWRFTVKIYKEEREIAEMELALSIHERDDYM